MTSNGKKKQGNRHHLSMSRLDCCIWTAVSYHSIPTFCVLLPLWLFAFCFSAYTSPVRYCDWFEKNLHIFGFLSKFSSNISNFFVLSLTANNGASECQDEGEDCCYWFFLSCCNMAVCSSIRCLLFSTCVSHLIALWFIFCSSFVVLDVYLFILLSIRYSVFPFGSRSLSLSLSRVGSPCHAPFSSAIISNFIVGTA